MLQLLEFLKGRRLERLQRWAEAQVAYQEALTGAFTRIAEWHYRLGLVQYKQQQWPAAKDSLQTAIVLSDRHAQWHYRLGLTLERCRQ